jgi:Cft2 family RNA processing exonuclease
MPSARCRCKPVPYYTPQRLADGLFDECYDAGHMLGSSVVMLHHRKNGKRIRLAYSGDVGRPRAAHPSTRIRCRPPST